MIRINSNGFAFIELMVILGIFFLFQFVSNSYTSRHANEAIWVGKMDWRLRILATAFFSSVGLIMFIFQKYNDASPMLLVNLKLVTLILVMMFVSTDVVIASFDIICLGYLIFRGITVSSLFYIMMYAAIFFVILFIGNTPHIKHWVVRLILFNLAGLLFWVGYYSYNVLYAKTYTASLSTVVTYMIQMVVLISIPYMLSYSMQLNQEMIFKRTQAAYIDGLTHTYNYHAFNLNMEHTFQRSQEKGLPLAMMIMDLDHFKCINDTYGHLAGNYVLINFCLAVKRALKSKQDASFYRIGGEEFALVFSQVSTTDAEAASQAVLMEVRDTVFQYKGNIIDLTFSGGLNSTLPTDETSKEFFDRVDLLTYTAKRHGGNQIVSEATDLTITADENMADKISAADRLASERADFLRAGSQNAEETSSNNN